MQVPGGLFPQTSFEDDVSRNTYMVGHRQKQKDQENDYTWMFVEERT